MEQKTKNLVLALSVVVFMAFLVWLVAVSPEGAETSAEYTQSSLSGSGQHFDFGTIDMRDGEVSHEFEIENKESEAVVINKIYTTCMCTEAYIVDASGEEHGPFGMPGHGGRLTTDVRVNPGEKAIVRTVFDPAAHGPSGVGLAQRSIYLETNSSHSPKMEVSFSAMVTR
ncbi:MAG: DUF1573 domain-containing protein [Candidatus Spechtbacterales bacterium]|nr:DUF1573 domain-containing protein [Candidatus Spechtbacterales bacterium]